MSINLPHWLVEIVDVLGFLWPEIDEDQLGEAGRHLREYAEHSSQASAAHGRQIADLGEHYDGQSYAALAQAWSNQGHGNIWALPWPRSSLSKRRPWRPSEWPRRPCPH